MSVTLVREVIVLDDIAFVQLSNGQTAIVDASDAALVGAYNWNGKTAAGKTYAIRSVPCPAKGQKTVYMHRFIIGDADGFDIDHIDGDGLNNRRAMRCNLCVASAGGCSGACRNNDRREYGAAVLPQQKGCICPPTAEKTCQRWDCGRKGSTVGPATSTTYGLGNITSTVKGHTT